MKVVRHVSPARSLVLAAVPSAAQPTVSNEFFEAKIRLFLRRSATPATTARVRSERLPPLDSKAGVMKGARLDQPSFPAIPLIAS